MDLDFWVGLFTVFGVAIGSGLVAMMIAKLISGFGRRRGWVRVQTEIRLCRRPWVATVTALATTVAVQHFVAIEPGWRRAAWIPVLVAACWLLICVARVAESVAFNGLPMGPEDDHRIRRARNRVAMLRRLITVTSTVLGLGGVLLLLLPGLPAVGASLFASAGVAGIVAGLAAQATLANVFAGMQLALTDAVRIDDVVVVEGEWGWIEEITLTYVVLHIWDERRLVLPTSYFTTMPFQNWTRHKAQLLGSVFLHLDYATPLTALRQEAQRVIEASALWDRKDWVLQVTDTTRTTMVVRVLASAKDGPTSWDLRCEIREALLVYLQENSPQALPVHRLLTVPEQSREHDPEDQPDQVDLTTVERHVVVSREGVIPRRADLRRAERSAGSSVLSVPAPRRARARGGPR